MDTFVVEEFSTLMFDVLGRFIILAHPVGERIRYMEYLFLLAFVLKHSNAPFGMIPRNEILLELCPAETNVLSDAGATG